MGNWSKPLPAIKATTAAGEKVDRSGAAKVDPKQPPKQRMAWYAYGPMLMGVAWAAAQELRSPTLTYGAMATITALSYAYCDFWLWVLHCFLDRPENLSSRFFFIKVSAFDFQEHHDLPAKILTENHLGTIDEVILGTMTAALLVGAWTGPEWKLWAVGVCVWGALGCLNHYFCHVRTHARPIPWAYKQGQDWGLLPTAKHHKTHHTSPFEENWNFLVGGHIIYEWVYAKTGTSYWGLGSLFYLGNPFVFQLIAVGVASAGFAPPLLSAFS